MAKKLKQTKIKSLKKTLLLKIEGRLKESFADLPRNVSKKKYNKIIHKAGKKIIKSFSLTPSKTSVKKDSIAKARKSTAVSDKVS